MRNKETRIQDEIRLKLSEKCPGIALRANAGAAWQGDKVWSHELGQYVLTNLRPYRGLPKGFSDLFYIGPDGDVAFLEVKTATGRTSPEQDRFLELMRKYGHSAAVVRSAEEAVAYINDKSRRRGYDEEN